MARTKDFNEEEVLDKALAIFWHKGYNATSMQDLVDGLDISRSSLYDTYTDKYTLYIKSLERYCRESVGQMRQLITQQPSPKAALTQLLQAAVNESLSDNVHRGCYMVNSAIECAPHYEAIAKLVNENNQDIEDIFYLAIQKGQEAGEFSTRQDARALARFIFNTISGIRVAAKSGADKKIYEDVMKVTLSVLD